MSGWGTCGGACDALEWRRYLGCRSDRRNPRRRGGRSKGKRVKKVGLKLSRRVGLVGAERRLPSRAFLGSLEATE